jgi:hypothetical protein
VITGKGNRLRPSPGRAQDQVQDPAHRQGPTRRDGQIPQYVPASAQGGQQEQRRHCPKGPADPEDVNQPPHPIRRRAQDTGNDHLRPRIGLQRKNRAQRAEDRDSQPDPIRAPPSALPVAERGEDKRTPVPDNGARHGDRLRGHRTPPDCHGGHRFCRPGRRQDCPSRKATRGRRVTRRRAPGSRPQLPPGLLSSAATLLRTRGTTQHRAAGPPDASADEEPCIPCLSHAAHLSPMRGTPHIIPRTRPSIHDSGITTPAASSATAGRPPDRLHQRVAGGPVRLVGFKQERHRHAGCSPPGSWRGSAAGRLPDRS